MIIQRFKSFTKKLSILKYKYCKNKAENWKKAVAEVARERKQNTLDKRRTEFFNPFDLSDPDPDRLHINEHVLSKPLFDVERLKNRNCAKNDLHSSDDSLDSGFENESFLSFASTSNDEDSVSSLYNNFDKMAYENLTEEISKIKDRCYSSATSITQGYSLPIISESTKDIMIPQISPSTLTNLLSGNPTLKNNITIFDCRFPYEYSGGHILNSVNVYTCQQLVQTFFGVQKPFSDDSEGEYDFNAVRKHLKKDQRIYIFYCEYSSYRAPNLAQSLRMLDRLAHCGDSGLFIPNIYILHGGYKDFYETYPEFCIPHGYVKMKVSKADSYITMTSSTKIDSGKCKREKIYIHQVHESEKRFQAILKASKKNEDIVNLFLSHPVIGRN